MIFFLLKAAKKRMKIGDIYDGITKSSHVASFYLHLPNTFLFCFSLNNILISYFLGQ